MRWTYDDGSRDWHPWFAWYPVHLCHPNQYQRVWWEWIERSTVNAQGYMCHSYRLPLLETHR